MTDKAMQSGVSLSDSRRILRAAAEFLFLAGLSALPAASVAVDIRVLRDHVGETSLTEISQAALLLGAVTLCWFRAAQQPAVRGFALLAGGLFACMLIRELDGWLDSLWHGFWSWPALFTAAATIGVVALRCRDTVWPPMAAFIGTRAFYHISFGLLTLLVFSRIFGSGRLWAELMGTDYGRLFKASLQEGLELYGYVFLSYGTFWFLRPPPGK
jgi:hypothetical protein